MLKIYIGCRADVIYDPPSYFDFNYMDEWLEDPLVKEMIRDVDKSEVISSSIIDSPILGPIPPVTLSGGVKTLILLLKEDSVKFNITSCGDNCAKWVKHISELKDIDVDLQYLMPFPEDIKALVLNSNKEVTNYLEYLYAYCDVPIEERMDVSAIMNENN